MNDSARPLGGRLPLADPATLTTAQRELYDQLIGSWVMFTDKLGIQSTTEDGRLIGPFNALLLHPEVAAKLLEFQAAESRSTGLPPSVREVVIIVLGAVYGADYELYAHTSVARTAGLADDHVLALSGGNIPDGLGEHEKLAARHHAHPVRGAGAVVPSASGVSSRDAVKRAGHDRSAEPAPGRCRRDGRGAAASWCRTVVALADHQAGDGLGRRQRVAAEGL
jgi:4-carboxymuconolactone decarboxylase